MNRVVMKNGDVINLESYDWKSVQDSEQLDQVIGELRQKAENCKNDYPGRTVHFCFNSQYGSIPDKVKVALGALDIAVEKWP